MEHQGQYLMWVRSRRGILRSHSQATNDSWEEKAFAEDASGHLGGGCIWPPRSYSCSFCKREFRSAQALGGHMNVHRRDRARLKQSLSGDFNDHDNPNTTVASTTSFSSSRVSALSNQENSSVIPREDDSSMVSCKKPKKTGVSAFSFMIKPCSSDRCTLQSDVNGHKHNGSMEVDIDLELRLGGPPKVKQWKCNCV